MRRISDGKLLFRNAFRLVTASCIASSAALLAPLVSFSSVAYAQEQNEDTRVMWQIHYDDSLSAAQRDEIQNTLLSTLSRVKERHFATPSIISSKIKNEGLQMPSCFENGGPCTSGPAFLLDVHQVDVYVDATFSKIGDTWRVELKLFRRLSASSNTITQSGKNLGNLINNVVGSLFVLESSIDVTSQIPDVEIYLNQKLIGTTPLAMKITEGPQKLTFKKDGYFPTTWEFNAKKGAIHTYEVELKPETTQFTVLASDPNASIFIDSIEVGKAGEMREILPGEHNVKVTSDFYHDYEQSIMVYSGNPQTMQVSMRPLSRDPFDVRHDGISRYRFSATAGYHFALQKFSMQDQTIRINRNDGVEGNVQVSPGSKKGNQTTKWADTSFHGMTFALNYEAEYWGVTIARLDLMGSPISSNFGLYGQNDDDDGRLDKIFDAQAKGSTLIAFYPAQIKGHYTFWVMQAEAVAGIGLSWLQLRSKILDGGELAGYSGKSVNFSRTQFSANFDFALKYFFSEESFAMFSYGFQIDAEKHNTATFRHGATFAVGLQIPLFMRDKKTLEELEKGIMLDDNADIGQPTATPPAIQIVDDGDDGTEAPDTIDVPAGAASDAAAPAVEDAAAPAVEDAAPAVEDVDAPAVEDADVTPVSAVFSVKEVSHV